jgi:hypothetical protein
MDKEQQKVFLYKNQIQMNLKQKVSGVISLEIILL